MNTHNIILFQYSHRIIHAIILKCIHINAHASMTGDPSQQYNIANQQIITGQY